MLHHCLLNKLSLREVYSQMQGSGVFIQVRYADRDTEYRITVATSVTNHEGGGELGSAVVSGATLMPMQISEELKAEVRVSWKGYLLKQYLYELPYTKRVSLLSMNQNFESELAESLASHFIVDFQKDNIFSVSALTDKLSSSNYEVKFIAPKETSEFKYYIYRHPFLGIQSRYLEENVDGSYIDAYVYPIKHWELGNVTALLEKELLNNKKDIEYYAKEAKLEKLGFIINAVENWGYNSEEQMVVMLESTYTDQSLTDFKSITYLMMKEDKFIKIRATYPNYGSVFPDVEKFAKEFYASVVVPSESMFMSRLRKKWRDQQGLM